MSDILEQGLQYSQQGPHIKVTSNEHLKYILHSFILQDQKWLVL